MTTHEYQTLSESLAELERTDPAVRQASENYDRVVRRVTGRETRAERRRRGRIESRGGVIHGVECYEAWRDLRDCPHEEDRP